MNYNQRVYLHWSIHPRLFLFYYIHLFNFNSIRFNYLILIYRFLIYPHAHFLLTFSLNLSFILLILIKCSIFQSFQIRPEKIDSFILKKTHLSTSPNQPLANNPFSSCRKRQGFRSHESSNIAYKFSPLFPPPNLLTYVYHSWNFPFFVNTTSRVNLHGQPFRCTPPTIYSYIWRLERGGEGMEADDDRPPRLA